MRLSEAIALGYSEIHHTNKVWLTQHGDGLCSGCAIGAALFAVGVRVMRDPNQQTLETYWPWTRNSSWISGYITTCYEQVLDGKLTMEQLIDAVRTIEPAEAPPSSEQSASSTPLEDEVCPETSRAFSNTELGVEHS
jgi:hypothetical protein